MLGCILALTLVGCGQSSGKSTITTGSYKRNEALAASGNVSLKMTGNTSTFKAMQDAITAFKKLYPKCTIEYEYLQDYSNALTTRLANNDNVDLFVTNNIQSGSPYYPYALELNGQGGGLDLSNTYSGLIRNFTVTESGKNELYAVPLGGELRGMFVNTTLLDSLGLKVPTNYSEFMACCQSLKNAGYVPIQGNPGNFGQLLMYPHAANIVANASDYQAVYDEVERCDPGVSELFREPMSRLYAMVSNGYYDYKYVETNYKAFTQNTDDVAAKSFLNIVSDNNGGYKKADDRGQVAFMPRTMSFTSTLDKTKDDYHSSIKYEFILSPMGDDGGYAYLSPSTGLAINRNSANTAWALEFMNFLFSKDVNKSFAADMGITPNTSDAMDAVTSTFKIPQSHVSQLGQVSFSYGFYGIIDDSLTDISKANNPKYMQSDGTMYDLEHYMNNLETAFASQRS